MQQLSLVEKPKEKTVRKIQKAPATSSDDSSSIFKGYTGEKAKAQPRVFTKKYKGSYKILEKSI